MGRRYEIVLEEHLPDAS